MTEQIIIWVLGVLSTLFGGLNIFQWITLRSYKRIKSAEADKAEIQNLKDVIETIQGSMQSEIERLRKRVEEAEKRAGEAEKRASDNADKYFALYQKYDTLREEFEAYKRNHKK